MEGNYGIAGKGLNLVFVAQIISIVSVFLMLIPIVGVVLGIVALAMSIYGLNVASSTHSSYKTAMILAAAQIALSILGAIFSEGILSGLLDVANTIAAFLIVFYVCNASADLLTDKGDAVQADRGHLVWKLYAVCTIINVICTLLMYVPLLNILAGIMAIIMLIVQLVAYILYLVFLNKASGSLQR